MADVRARMLALLGLLQSGRGWSGAELADRLGTSHRSVRRDVDRLRELGYPVASRPGPGGHYRLEAGTAMPPLLFDDDEAVAVAVGLRLVTDASVLDVDEDASRRALRKLEQVLPPRLRAHVAGVHDVTETGTSAGPTVGIERLSQLGDAASRHERVELRYVDREGAATIREVEPYRQVLSRGRWYLLAYDLGRDDWRTFRLDRIEGVTPLRVGFRARQLPAASAAAYLDAAVRAPRTRAVVSFDAPIARVADRLPVVLDGELEPLGADRCRFTVEVDSFAWLALRIATLGLPFRIEAPEAFVADAAELADRLCRAAGGRAAGPDQASGAPQPAGSTPPGMSASGS